MFRRIAAIVCSLLLALCASGARAVSVTVSFPPRGGELVNPFIGHLVWAADDPEDIAQPFTLVYANLRWADLEPREGVYDFAAFERANQLDAWRQAGKRLVLRFVMDVPSKKKHRDIPDWLWKKTSKRGKAYSCPYGKGWCPDYADPTLMAAHEKALAAIAAHFAGDDFLCCVELGSLGHWGEWHVHAKAGAMPDAAVRAQYAAQYRAAFPDTMLLARRPFAEAAAGGMGLFNDAAGAPKATGQWLDWIARGGVYDQTGEEDALVPMPDAWQTAMIGGELSTDIAPEKRLSDLDTTIALFEMSHASWIGPHGFSGIARGGARQDALDALMCRVGYRLRVASVTLSDDRALTLRWTNTGVAPFYFPWRAAVRFTMADGTARVQPTDLDLPALLPDETLETTVTLPAGCAAVAAGILDPATGEAAVQLDMCGERDGEWYWLLAVGE